MDGVVAANVNLATEKASVMYIPGVAGLAEFKEAVADVGYEVLEVSGDAAVAGAEDGIQEQRKMAASRFRMWVAWVFTVTGLNTTMSALNPSRSKPRSGMPNRCAGNDVILRMASGNRRCFSARTNSASTIGKQP